MKRITVPLDEETYEWLRARAFSEQRSVGMTASQLLDGVRSLGQASRNEKLVVATTAEPSLIPDLQEESKRIERQLGKRTPPEGKSVWSVICPLRNAHDYGEVCPHCGGSGPR